MACDEHSGFQEPEEGLSTSWPVLLLVSLSQVFQVNLLPCNHIDNVTTFTFDSRHPCIRASVLKLGLG